MTRMRRWWRRGCFCRSLRYRRRNVLLFSQDSFTLFTLTRGSRSRDSSRSHAIPLLPMCCRTPIKKTKMATTINRKLYSCPSDQALSMSVEKGVERARAEERRSVVLTPGPPNEAHVDEVDWWVNDLSSMTERREGGWLVCRRPVIYDREESYWRWVALIFFSSRIRMRTPASIERAPRTHREERCSWKIRQERRPQRRKLMEKMRTDGMKEFDDLRRDWKW